MDAIRDWFELARDRTLPPFLFPPSDGGWLNLGQGRRPIGDARPLDLEHGWNADTDPIPVENETVSAIFAHAFFGYVADPVRVLAECQRVLKTGGVIYIVEPHALSDLWHEDVQRKSRFTEETWKNLFNNKYWTGQKVGAAPAVDRLEVHACFIMGVVWRNLSLFTQLVKR